MTERTALPDLNQLNPEELKTLIVTQHQQLLSKDEQLASRDSEIEQLKLLIAKLQRMQFGRKSEKLERQIEQLQLRLEALQMNDAERVAVLPKQPKSVERMVRPVRSPLPALRRNTAQVGRRRLGDLGTHPGTLLRDPAGAGEAGLHQLRQDRASESSKPADRAWNRWARAFGPCAGLEVCGSSSLVPTGRDF
jgi:Transposase C of IS166 homeodomain